MSAHLSDLALDALAARGGEHPHLEACGTCRVRLQAFRVQRARTLDDPSFRRVGEGLRLPRRPGMRLYAVAAPIAAAALLLLLGPRTRDRTRAKGRPFLELVTERGERADRVLPGAHVGITLNGAGHPYALVLSRDVDGGWEQVWPVRADRSEAIPPTAARLEPPFEVTPGSAHLVAVLSDRPLLSAEVLADVRAGRAPGGERARAEAELTVEEHPQ